VSKDNRRVVFRRVRGRIVPIRMKEASIDVAGGTAVAVGTGYIAGKMFDAPKGVRKLAKNKLFQSAAEQARHVFRPPMSDAFQATFPEAALGQVKRTKNNPVKAYRQFKRLDNVAKIMPKLAVPLFIGGAALGGALIARGIAKGRNEKKPTLGTAVAQNIGDAGAFGVAGLTILRTRGVKFGPALKEVFTVTPSFLKKFKR